MGTNKAEETPLEKAINYLREKGILGEIHTKWIIKFGDGTEVDFVNILSEYRQSEIDELTKEVERLRNLITKYAYHVTECEGVDFLSDGWNENSYFTESEWKTLQELRPKY